MATYKVLRRLDGDKLYEPGDTREMIEADAAHLVATGALEPAKAKAEKAPANKMEPDLQNKADQPTSDSVADRAPARRGHKPKKG
jgi:hypothetical protein